MKIFFPLPAPGLAHPGGYYGKACICIGSRFPVDAPSKSCCCRGIAGRPDGAVRCHCTDSMFRQHPLAVGHAAVPEAAYLQAWCTMQRQRATALTSQASALAPAAAPSSRLSNPQEHASRSACQSCLVMHLPYSMP